MSGVIKDYVKVNVVATTGEDQSSWTVKFDFETSKFTIEMTAEQPGWHTPRVYLDERDPSQVEISKTLARKIVRQGGYCT